MLQGSVLFFSTKYHSFHNFVSFCSNYTFSTKHAVKFKYQPRHSKDNNSIFAYKGTIFAHQSLHMAAVSDVGSIKKWRGILNGVLL
jgi:hypothetical protein